MFERFTRSARTVVVLAQEDARRRHQDHVRTENMLLGLLGVPGAPAATLLEQAGIDRPAVEAALGDAAPADCAPAHAPLVRTAVAELGRGAASG